MSVHEKIKAELAFGKKRKEAVRNARAKVDIGSINMKAIYKAKYQSRECANQLQEQPYI